jgi:hypothetical protein
MDLVARLTSKIRIDPDSGCWVWTASTRGPSDLHQYGQIRVGGRGGQVRSAHRVMFELVMGAVPDDLVIDHLCRNTRCVNPAHLEPVTNRENVLRGDGHSAVNARRVVCASGHPLVGQNVLIVGPTRRRRCRTCKIEDARRRRAALRATGA